MSNKLSGTLTLRLPSGDSRFKAFFNVGESGFATEEYVKQQIVESEKKEEGKYVEKTDIQDTLNSDNSNKPLSANQGKVLKGLLDAKVIEAGAVPMDTEPTEGNVNNVVSSDGLAKEFNKSNTEIVLGGIYDVSAHNNGAVFESLSVLLNSSNLSTLIPTSVRHGGMSIRFIQGSEQSSDNKYVQARLMANTFTTDVTQWQGVDDEPTAGSDNLVKSGGIAKSVDIIDINVFGKCVKGVETVVYHQTNIYPINLTEGDYVYKGTGDAGGAVTLTYTDDTTLVLNGGSGINPNTPISFTAAKQVKNLKIWISTVETNYGFEITKSSYIKKDVETNKTNIQNQQVQIDALHDIIFDDIVHSGFYTKLKTLENVALDKGILFGLSGWNTDVFKVETGKILNLYKNGVQSNLRYGLYKTEPVSGSTTSLASNNANNITVPNDQDYYIAVTDNNGGTFSVEFVNSQSIEGDVNELKKNALSSSSMLETTTEQGKYLDHNNGYIGSQSEWTIGTCLAKAGTILTFYADSVNSSCRYALYNNTATMDNFTGISGGGAKTIIVPPDKDYIVVICLHSVVTEFSVKQHIICKFDKEIAEIKENINNTTHKVLWLGTSIPAYSHYPERVCSILGHTCYNMALGSSGIIVRTGYLGSERDGKDLCESANEKETRYRPYVTSGSITEEQLNQYKTYGYDARVIPYIDGTIDNCDVVVIDHGYNDRDTVAMQSFIDGFDELDMSVDVEDNVYDRSNFIGAYRFLLHKIFEINPNIKVVICSYLENKTCGPEFPKPTWDSSVIYNSGYQICTLLELIARHYDFPYLDMCNYNGYSMEYMPGTNDYLAGISSSYTVKKYTSRPNTGNNVTKFQYYCPDGVHPHTDPTGHSIDILVQSLTKLMRDI